jgi:peptidoglycan/LPS O-acetylase OafA/YrhL
MPFWSLDNRTQSAIGSSYRSDVDGLRAIAVLLVVAFHSYPKHLTGGFIGVDVFFVISGYLISRLIGSGLAEGRFSLAEFYIRRIKRIFPALAVVLLACLLFGWFTIFPLDYRALGLWRTSPFFKRSDISTPPRISSLCFISGRSVSRSNSTFSGRF